MTTGSARVALGAAALAAGLLALGATAPAVAADQQCDVTVVPESDALAPDDTTSNPVHDRLRVADAHEIGRGRGTTVAVIDSGVAPVEKMAVVRGPVLADTATLESGHGTIVAGLIAGPDGVAPEATIYDVQVFDAETIDATEGKQVTSAGIVAGIRAVIAASAQRRIDVVNISLAAPTDDPRLEDAVADLVARDTVVVASAGNKMETDEEGFAGTPDSDARVYPADYPGVLAVSAVPPGDQDPADHVLPNRDTDVAAPTLGAVSVNATDRRCVIPQVATSWATAEVSGIVALLRQRFPDETPRQIIARLEATTEGAGVQAPDGKADNPWTGAGVVQAHDALTRQITPRRSGEVVVSTAQVGADAQAPPAPQEVDLFGSSRALLLWTGLLAGGLLALAFMLRPLIRR